MNDRIQAIERAAASWMARHGILLSRVGLGVIFVWFGGLKLFPGLSPAEGLAGGTLEVLTLGMLEPRYGVPLLGAWECLIGVGFLAGALRASVVAMLAHMVGTISPAFLFPDQVFARFPAVLTFEGQYIVKNLALVSAAIVIGATVRGGSLRSEPESGTAARDDDRRTPQVSPVLPAVALSRGSSLSRPF